MTVDPLGRGNADPPTLIFCHEHGRYCGSGLTELEARVLRAWQCGDLVEHARLLAELREVDALVDEVTT